MNYAIGEAVDEDHSSTGWRTAFVDAHRSVSCWTSRAPGIALSGYARHLASFERDVWEERVAR